MSAPIETKVKASTVTGTVVAFVAALVSRYLWGDGPLPEPVVALIGAAVTGVGTFAAGWLARHTPRFATGGLIKPGTQILAREGDPPPKP